MGSLLLAITLLLYGVNMLTSILPTIVFGILFIITGLLLLFEHRNVVVR